MGKKIIFVFAVVALALILTGRPAHAEDVEDAEAKAREIHQRASSDVIFIDDELKALYYQNVQIISLLKEIRDLLGQTLVYFEEEKKSLEGKKEPEKPKQ